MLSFKLEGPVFDSIIRVKTMDNKPGSFLLSGVIACMQTKTLVKRGISSLNFVVITFDYEPTSTSWEKY